VFDARWQKEVLTVLQIRTVVLVNQRYIRQDRRHSLGDATETEPHGLDKHIRTIQLQLR
jgi:hypothetical protein